MVLTVTDDADAVAIADERACCTGLSRGGGGVTEADAEVYAAWFKALADPTRIRILHQLARAGEPVCVCDITDQFPLGQPTISHHLKILRDARFVFAERRGTYAYYSVNHVCLGEFPEAARRIMNAGQPSS